MRTGPDSAFLLLTVVFFVPGSLNESGLVLGGPESGGPGGGGGPVLACPLQCGLDPVALPFLRAHLVAFHGCDLDSIKVTEAKVKIYFSFLQFL